MLKDHSNDKHEAQKIRLRGKLAVLGGNVNLLLKSELEIVLESAFTVINHRSRFQNASVSFMQHFYSGQRKLLRETHAGESSSVVQS